MNGSGQIKHGNVNCTRIKKDVEKNLRKKNGMIIFEYNLTLAVT
jgi:hypothetical protein